MRKKALMEVIPAIDLIDGTCVRLFQGRFDQKKEYSPDPLGIARGFREDGARWIHVIDLDGARTGRPMNLEVAAAIKKETGLKVEYGGGIRDIGTLQRILQEGIDRPILGTKAVEDPAFLQEALEVSGGKAILSLDYDQDCMILIKGWQQPARVSLFDLAKKIKKAGIGSIITTDISRDGTLEGIDIVRIRKVLKETGLRLYIAGGVTDIEDIRRLKEIEDQGIAGVIIGKALYEGSIHYPEALEIGGKS